MSIKNKKSILLVILLLLRFTGMQYDFALNSSNIDSKVMDQIAFTDSVLLAQYEPLDEVQINKIYKRVYKSTILEIDNKISAFAKKSGFNGTILLAKDGIPLYKKNIGYSDFKNKIALSDSSEFQLASVSKQFTAVAILLLEEQNKLNIDDDINYYFPKLHLSGVTIKHLLNHTSGLSDYIPIVLKKWTEKYPPTNTDVVSLLEKNRLKQRFSPGSRFQYSNTGYFLLASIVEKVSKKSMNDFLKENVFTPLGMHHTKVYNYGLNNWDSQQIKGFKKNNYKYKAFKQGIIDGVVGDKGVYASADDLLKWSNALYNGYIISKKTLGNAIRKSELNNGASIKYGFGLRITENFNGKMIYHNGSWGGFRTTSRYYINESVSLIILSNNSYRYLGSLARKVKGVLDRDHANEEFLYVVKKMLLQKEMDNSMMQVSVWQKNELKDIVDLINLFDHQWLAQKFQKSIIFGEGSDDNLYAMYGKNNYDFINFKDRL
ncbi:MAG: serine hydrolase domain-containing protein [Bacteroidota bacterium]|nr:serine hydrolase domain-containing protein [Bacteroidota bacterium]